MFSLPKALTVSLRFSPLDTAFFILSKLLGAALKLETWLLVMAVLTFWASQSGRLRLVQALSAGTAAVILLVGLIPIGDILMRPLETKFPIQDDLGNIEGIIVLGGGEDVPASLLSGQPQLGEGGDRYVAAVMLAHRFPDSRVVFAGGSGRLRDVTGAETSEAEIAKQVFKAVGIAPERLLFEGQSRNTTENAANAHKAVQPEEGSKWALVTSAFHMPRALGSFKAAGWQHVVPFPVDFRTRDLRNGFGWNFQRNLGLVNTAVREWVGRAVYSVTGR